MNFPHLAHWKHLPKLPRGAAYMIIDNRKTGNALSLDVIKDLKQQLIKFNTSPTGRKLFLPPFKPQILSRLERSMDKYQRYNEEDEYTWLVSSKVWERERRALPRMIVLASGNMGINFCSGHNLQEIRDATRLGGREAVRDIFTACAELMTLLRRSPVLVATRVKGNAYGAGVQLAFATDLPIGHANLHKNFLPGRTLGFPCSSPGVVLGRSVLRTPHEVMAALIDGEIKHRVHQVKSPGVTDPKILGEALDDYLYGKVEENLKFPSQPMAMAKWAAYTQMTLRGQNHLDADGNEVEGCGGDGLEDALAFAARVMALHSQSEDALDAMDAFIYKSNDKKNGRKTSLASDVAEQVTPEGPVEGANEAQQSSGPAERVEDTLTESEVEEGKGPEVEETTENGPTTSEVIENNEEGQKKQ